MGGVIQKHHEHYALCVCIGNDVLLAQAWNAIGDYYADRQKW